MLTGFDLAQYRLLRALRGAVAGQVLNQQIPAGALESLSQWPTDEPYSVIASKELGLCETMLGKEFPSTDEHEQPAAVLRDQGKYGQAGEMYRQAIGLSEDLKTKPSMLRLESIHTAQNRCTYGQN
jgi:hypothetical protein